MAANLTTKLGQLVDVLTPDTTNTRIGVANASPTRTLDVTGTFGASGASTLGGALTYGGITLSNAVTGTGNMVLSAGPTLTGTLTAAAANFSGAVGVASTIRSTGISAPASGAGIEVFYNSGTGSILAYDRTGSAYRPLEISGSNIFLAPNGSNTVTVGASLLTISTAINYGGVTLSNSVTGTGSMVLSASPTLTGDITINASINSGLAIVGTSGQENAFRMNHGGTASTTNIQFYRALQTNNYTWVDVGFDGTNYGVYGSMQAGSTPNYTLNIPYSTGYMAFQTNNTERARIGSDGSFLVGGTTNVGAGGIYASSVIRCGTTSSVFSGQIECTNATGECFGANMTNNNGNAAYNAGVSYTAGFLHNFYWTSGGQTKVGSISTNGTTTAFNTTSDKRLKTFVAARDNGDLFDKVEWNEFTWNSAPHLGVQVGGFAQDIQKHIPNVIKEGVGEPGEPGFSPWQLDYTGLVPYLGAEVKSLRARLATLEARLTALESK